MREAAFYIYRSQCIFKKNDVSKVIHLMGCREIREKYLWEFYEKVVWIELKSCSKLLCIFCDNYDNLEFSKF
jgi:hypothetical protein